jgi:internalin A
MKRPLAILTPLVFCLFATPVHARDFRSNFNLEVFEKGEGGDPDRYLGFTREEGPHTVDVPRGSMWYMRPIGRYSVDDFNRLFDDIKAQNLPGLSLSNRWDVSNDTIKSLEDGSPLIILLLGNTRITDEGLASIASVTHLERLSLPRQITDAKLRELSGLTSLRSINLNRSKITDKGLAILAKLPHLESLNVGGTRITDAGAKILGTMSSLKQLDISETAITDRGIQQVARCSNLESLYLNRHLTDAGIASVASLTKLKILDVSGSQITDAGMVALKKLSRLKELALSGTRVGDAGMRSVAPLSDLRVLELSDTQVSSQGMADVGHLSRLETLSVSWDELSNMEWQALGTLKHLTTVILNGSRMAPDALNHVRDLAKLHSKSLQRTASLENRALHPVNVPERELSSVPGSGATLQEASRPAHPVSLASPEMPADLVPNPSQKSAIYTDETPQGKGMEFEVGVSPKRQRASKTVLGLTGLKRVHEVEYEESSGGPDMELVDNAAPAPADTTPAKSLGEINVNATRSHAR